MSGNARRRGQGRGPPPQNSSGRGPSLGGKNVTDGRNRISNFDGPASQGTGSAVGSQGPPSVVSGQGTFVLGSHPGSRRSSVSTSAQHDNTNNAPPMNRFDPALDRPPQFTDSLRNVDLPASFYNVNNSHELPTEFSRRPGLNTTGKSISLPVNCYKVTSYPSIAIWQYDVIIGNGAEKKPVVDKVWKSKARQNITGPPMLFDGNKLAWSSTDHGTELRIMVDLDAESGRNSKDDRNTFRLHLRRSRKLDLSIVVNYLAGRIQYSIGVGEAINFLDHLIREGPSQNPNMVTVKRSFYTRNGSRADLGGGIEVFRGVYQSIRLAHGHKLVVNLDVANGCFYKPDALVSLILVKNKLRGPEQISQLFNKGAGTKATKGWMSKLRVKATYAGNPAPNREWQIKTISNATANSHKIQWRDPQTRKETDETLSITMYFRRRYNITLRLPNLPLVEMTKKGTLFPMELLYVNEHQRYGAKLDETQTANMIKFAVAPPSVRSKAIDEGKSWLKWDDDKYLRNYGLEINNQPIITQARILPAPGIRFGNSKIEQPGTKGRWDLRGKSFIAHNPKVLEAWGIGVFQGRTQLDQSQIQRFALDFTKQYRGHGGQVSNKPPFIMNLGNLDAAQAVHNLWQGTGNNFKQNPQILIFIVQSKEAFHYLRIKKSADCRFGVVSQVMQAAQVQKGNPQYYSNVLMKFNAKLGGTTSNAVPAPQSGFKGFGQPTLFIGADVSHASPGSEQPSMAAITVSFDRNAARYAAACQTNGVRVEMITEKNWHGMLDPLVRQWSSNVGGGNLPSQVYYMRDGVSEGQFAHVLRQEVTAIREVMVKIANGRGWSGKITVVIASKRHHIRAFPKPGDGDQKHNPLPGTIIEQDVTMPNEWDFYLYSHIALQGTSRPVHYTIILDEANHSPNTIQNMIYEHCYQFMRSTTSVSLHPAVYYAHTASNRAKAHEDVPAREGPRGGPGVKQNQPESSVAGSSEPGSLISMKNDLGIRFSMWYI